MVRGKFRFTFKSGDSMIDRNRIKTLEQAKTFARNHNKGTRAKSEKIVKVERVRRKRK